MKKFINMVVLVSLLAISITACSKEQERPSKEDVIREIKKAENIVFAKDLEVIEVKDVVKMKYGNIKDGIFPVKTFTLLKTNYGEVYVYQEMVFKKVVPDYGKPYWDGYTTHGIGEKKDTMVLSEFYKTPLGQGMK